MWILTTKGEVQEVTKVCLSSILDGNVLRELGYCFYFDYQNKKILRNNGQNITKFDIPSSYLALKKITAIGDSCFVDCKELEEINIPDGVTYIGE